LNVVRISSGTKKIIIKSPQKGLKKTNPAPIQPIYSIMPILGFERNGKVMAGSKSKTKMIMIFSVREE